MAGRAQGGTNLMISMLLSLGNLKGKNEHESSKLLRTGFGSIWVEHSSSSQPDAFNIHLRWMCKLLKRGENKVKGCR